MIKRNVWIFQGSIKKYKIEDSLKEVLSKDGEMHWTVNRYKKDIKIGDIGLIWMCAYGTKVGIYAVTEILSEPKVIDEFEFEQKYWNVEKNLPQSRVRMKLTKLLLDTPVYKTKLKELKETKDMNIIRCAMGTNFKVSETEWNKIEELISK